MNHMSGMTGHHGSLPWHQLVLALMALAAVAALATALRRGRLGESVAQGEARRPAPVQTSLRPVLAALSALTATAAGIHLAVIREHFLEDPLLGWFFLALTVSQLGYAAILLVRPSRRLLAVGIVGNLSVVGLWVYTRVVGIPFGIAGGELEAVGAADVLAAMVELAAAVLAARVLRRRAPAAATGVRLTTTHAGWGLMVVSIAGTAVSAFGH
ncbi:MAG: hypothetical protein QOK42_1709 [Frankiaceae bacterium]|nr:hypothetical protein [Frankiaceae bacterium]MDX6226078.1 hypothetical protein [Frankiales bacterium]